MDGAFWVNAPQIGWDERKWQKNPHEMNWMRSEQQSFYK